MKVDIISGFLGSGKTTLIKKFLKEEFYQEKLAIVENEYGEVSIDGPVLQQGSYYVKEIMSGCICCTLVGDFVDSMEKIIKDYSPQRIVIEPSGVAKLSEVISAVKKLELKYQLEVNLLIAVVDVLKYKMYLQNFGEFYRDQIGNARMVVLSRTGQVNSKDLKVVVDSIKTINNSAGIVTTPWEQITAGDITAAAEPLQEENILSAADLDRVFGILGGTIEDFKKPSGSRVKHTADEVFDVWGVETPVIFEKSKLMEILDALDTSREFGTILRAKGILPVNGGSWVLFDFVPGEKGMQDTSSTYTGRIAVIGKSLQKEKLKQLFQVER
ncbi:CobW family GTP-binding protein [Candidatus Contubernalis alkaliaceticus]|uniref:CobW family GTP-binding protein n=1 Tax=Candidatus Contubernalis alkaliaceticus TaxID=338645 RepID=UPI001F4BD26D|nr:GTP-binding protein [Candidatus Contubernalis alkalaceticus]